MNQAYKAIENNLSDSFCSKNDSDHKIIFLQIRTRCIFNKFFNIIDKNFRNFN